MNRSTLHRELLGARVSVLELDELQSRGRVELDDDQAERVHRYRAQRPRFLLRRPASASAGVGLGGRRTA